MEQPPNAECKRKNIRSHHDSKTYLLPYHIRTQSWSPRVPETTGETLCNVRQKPRHFHLLPSVIQISSSHCFSATTNMTTAALAGKASRPAGLFKQARIQLEHAHAKRNSCMRRRFSKLCTESHVAKIRQALNGYTSWNLADPTPPLSSLKASCNNTQLPLSAKLLVTLRMLKLNVYTCFLVSYDQLLAGRIAMVPGVSAHVLHCTPYTNRGYPGWKISAPVLQPNVKVNLMAAPPLTLIWFTAGGLAMLLPKPGNKGRRQPPLLMPLPL